MTDDLPGVSNNRLMTTHCRTLGSRSWALPTAFQLSWPALSFYLSHAPVRQRALGIKIQGSRMSIDPSPALHCASLCGSYMLDESAPAMTQQFSGACASLTHTKPPTPCEDVSSEVLPGRYINEDYLDVLDIQPDSQ